MDARQEIERRIDREKQKLSDLRTQIDKSEAFVLGLQEALKLLPRTERVSPAHSKRSLRAGSSVRLAYQVLQAAKRPMHISEILEAIGMENSRNRRSSLASSLGRYARQGKMFTNIGSNTFSAALQQDANGSLPDDFGTEEQPRNLQNNPVTESPPR